MNDWLALSRLPFTALMDPLLAAVAQNQIIADSFLTYTTGPLTLLSSYLIDCYAQNFYYLS